ncbi:hypothetical protein [Streptomyces sp. WAC07149]|uniref:hypothetical protein n=1 Tax=Streptomyces sp. WAC07149 TaxID=2487425 RepID=UPI0011DF1E4B|nr:hypothetical protein [Streptomyces sp. WAC07149]
MPSFDVVARAPVGKRTYPPAPPGTYWHGGRLWVRPAAGEALFFVHRLTIAHNGHQQGAAAEVDIRRGEQELDHVFVYSSSLSRELSAWTGRWVAVRVWSNGPRQQWRATALDSGFLAAYARDLNAAA